MASSSTEFLRINMASLGQILAKTFFWSYERGTWQYDLAVILILVFVLLTPRKWFHDRPESGGPTAPGQVRFISREGNRLTYRVDARILAPPAKLALQNDLRNALQDTLPELRSGDFSIAKIEPVRDDQGAVHGGAGGLPHRTLDA
jgi:hypothetical protein